MTRTPYHLVFRHLIAHWVRSGLTAAGMTVAMFLLCILISIVTSLAATVKQASSSRIIVESAVSLFVALPLDYQAKIREVQGVDLISKFQWFGGIYKSPENFFAQFAIDYDVFFDQYARDFRVVEGPASSAEGEGDVLAAVRAAMAADRRSALVGRGLMKQYGWKVGDTIPLIGTIFSRTGGEAWDFNIVGVYEPLKSNVDDRTMFFRFDYLDETLKAGGATGPQGVGTYAVNVATGADPAQVIADIDQIFANGPQKTKTTTEAAFQAQFVSMMGNLPMFIGTIGGAVVFAVFFSLVNTMLMSARQRVREAGILKALGFADGAIARLMLVESLLLSLLGGAAGVVLALLAATVLRSGLGTMIPNFAVAPGTAVIGLAVATLIGTIAGIAPSLKLARLRPTEALRSEG